MSEYKKVNRVFAEVDKIKARDYNQIIQNIEAIKGGEAFEEPISTIFDLNEKVDDEVSRIDKNINELKTLIGTGGGSGEIETKGKDIYGEEDVEVITNKVYKNKTVYRKSFYDKKYNEEIISNGVNKENISNLFINLKYGESAENYYYEIPGNVATMFRGEAQVYFKDGKIIPKLPSPEEMTGSSNSKDNIFYTAHIEYIKDSDNEITDFTDKDIYAEEGLEVITNKVWKNKTVYRKCFYDKKNMHEIVDSNIKLENIFSFQNKLSCALTESDSLQIATGTVIAIGTGEYKYQMLQLQIMKNEDKLFIYPTMINSHEDEETKEIYYEYSSCIEYIKDSDSEVLDFENKDVYGENEVETKTNKLLKGKEVYRRCLLNRQSSFDVNNLKIKRATIHSINQVARFGESKEKIFIVGGNMLSLGENGAMLYGAYMGESGASEYLSVLCTVGTAEGTFGEADVFIEYTKEKTNTEIEAKKDEYGESGVEILTNKTWKGKPVYRISYYSQTDRSGVYLKYSNVLNYFTKATLYHFANGIEKAVLGFNECIKMNGFEASVYLEIMNMEGKEFLQFTAYHNLSSEYYIKFDFHFEYIKD